MSGQQKRKARDRRAEFIDRAASLVADAMRIVADHADDITAWWDRRRAQRNEQGESL